MASTRTRGVLSALTAALLFGSVNAAARVAIQDGLQPLWTSAIMYVVGGIALAPILLRAPAIPRADRPRLAIVVLAGAIAAPLLIFYGLSRTSAVDASLLLNLEMLFTAMLAFFVLHERVRAREGVGLALIAASAVLVSLAAGAEGGSSLLGAALVALGALCWGVDNTASTPLARRIDPRALIGWKTLLGGAAVVLAAPLISGAPGGGPRDWALAAGVGLVGVAVSSVLFYRALRDLGATRTIVLFSLSSLVGAAIGHFVLGEPLSWLHLTGAAAAVAGVAIVARALPEP